MIVRQQQNRCVAMPVKHLRDSRLSLEAKGVFTMLTAFSNERGDIEINDALYYMTSSDKATVLSALIELMKHGYVHFEEDAK